MMRSIWKTDDRQVMGLLSSQPRRGTRKLAGSMLRAPLSLAKMSYEAASRTVYAGRIAGKSLTLVRVGPVTTRSPSAKKKP